MLGLAVAIVLNVATAALWFVLDKTGVFTSLTRTANDIVGTGSVNFDFNALVSLGHVMGVALLLSAVELILLSALTTLFAFLYNLTVGITGGIEVTLSDRG